MKYRVISVVLFFVSGSCLFAQLRPFPQNVNYPYGYKTSEISADDVQSAYNRWKGKFIKECNGMYRVCTDDEGETRSEGMGYGMLLSAYFGEKGVFDSLFAFYKSKRTSQALNLMAWKVSCAGITDYGSATDGDLDVAFALIIAHYQWEEPPIEDYLTEARNILSILQNDYFFTCGGSVYTMSPGCNTVHWGGCALTDISYYTPAYFKVFAYVTQDGFWDDVANDAYTILYNGTNSSTGLVPDWQSYDGVPGGDPPSGRDDYYHYDACRVPWRMALDYLWNGDVDARDWCIEISDFANGIGASGIRDGYELDGTVVGSYNNSSFVGGFAVGGMSHSQTMVDNFASRLLTLDGVGWDDQYFNFSLRCLYMLVLTGNFWDPLSPAGIEETDSLPEGFNLAQNYPNPFHTVTTIEYSISEASHVRLKIYDISGRHIKTLVDKKIPAGKYAARLEADDLLPGVHFYQLETDKNRIKKRMLLLK
ncbi:T9SS type A sorting domain-containing protein [candidate division WOR-3 bacterium]|nr:T9SS type A sorting domain-containing protein [candidate division WOR-3 bacterium]